MIETVGQVLRCFGLLKWVMLATVLETSVDHCSNSLGAKVGPGWEPVMFEVNKLNMSFWLDRRIHQVICYVRL